MGQDQALQKQPKITWKAIPAALLFVVLIPLTVYFTGKWIDRLLNFPLFPPFPLNWIIGPIVLGSGLVLAWGSIYQLYRAGLGFPWGPVDKKAESTQLVTTGLYAYTRNPMILGFLMLLSGIGWLIQSITAVLLIPLLGFVLLYLWLKVREEPRLEQRFGEAYCAYKQRTPRIIPRPWRRYTQPGRETEEKR